MNTQIFIKCKMRLNWEILCLVYLETGSVLWRDRGGAVTIQCSTSLDIDSLYLKKGLKEKYDVLFEDGNSGKQTIATEFLGRLQSHGRVPNKSILIKNLTSGDTDTYWCIYTKFDTKSGRMVDEKGTGSVLLVVRGEPYQCLYNPINPSVLTIWRHQLDRSFF